MLGPACATTPEQALVWHMKNMTCTIVLAGVAAATFAFTTGCSVPTTAAVGPVREIRSRIELMA
jgi:hypothetical protein